MVIAVEVTQEHIDNGQRWEPQSCPLALALIDKFGDSHVSVGSIDAVVGLTKARHFLLMPDASAFVKAIDTPVIPGPQPQVVHITEAP